MSQTFNVMATNPNVLSNGCLCSENGTLDSEGPYIVFNATETDNINAPFPVICGPCVHRAETLVAEAALPTYEPLPTTPWPEVKAKREARKPTSAKRSIDEGDGPTI